MARLACAVAALLLIAVPLRAQEAQPGGQNLFRRLKTVTRTEHRHKLVTGEALRAPEIFKHNDYCKTFKIDETEVMVELAIVDSTHVNVSVQVYGFWLECEGEVFSVDPVTKQFNWENKGCIDDQFKNFGENGGAVIIKVADGGDSLVLEAPGVSESLTADCAAVHEAEEEAAGGTTPDNDESPDSEDDDPFGFRRRLAGVSDFVEATVVV